MSIQITLPFDDDKQRMEKTVSVDGHAPIEATSHSTGSYRRYTTVSPSTDFDIALLALGRVRGIGIKTLRFLIEHYGNLNRVWQEDPFALNEILRRARVKDSATTAKKILSESDALLTTAQRDLDQLYEAGIRIIQRGDAAFPPRLAETPDSPYWLFAEGALETLQAPLIGIVGTRKPSAIGVQTTERLAALVCREGFGIVSGLAEGIDASAHRIGLYYQAPQVAVLGTGSYEVFPAGTAGIRRWIIETGGTIITEYLPYEKANRANFVQRNRIQAALALALVPVESSERSGTAHTLRFAQQYHRPVFGVQRGELAPANDITRMLRAQHYPMFDLAQQHDIEELVAWLRTVVPAQLWPKHRRQPTAHWFFEGVLRQIDDILHDVPVTTKDMQWLHKQIAQRVSAFAGAREEDAS